MTPQDTARKIRDALPSEGLFAEKDWRISPEPFPLPKKTVRALEKLGPVLYRFQRTCDLLYRRSKKGTLPDWVAAYLDQGKPPELTELGASGAAKESLPRVIRPDLILTDSGYAASELDSVPGGIGLTAWLAGVYSTACPDRKIVGGREGMQTGFRSLFPTREADILVSNEAGDYRPEMEWIAGQLKGDYRVCSAEEYRPGKTPANVYRFFELFDLPNLPGAMDLGRAAAEGQIDLISPYKPWLEEKMNAALFWSLPLREFWRQELREGNFLRLQKIFPRSWIVDPVELPHQAAIPGLEIQSFTDLKTFTRRERRLVLKMSGFHEKAWGSRSVTIGHDSSQEAWARAVDEAVSGFGSSPYVLQEFHSGKLVVHPWWDPESGRIEKLEGRVRLCPYYFADPSKKPVSLGGVLATICPADKKVIHGMREAILAPCCMEE